MKKRIFGIKIIATLLAVLLGGALLLAGCGRKEDVTADTAEGIDKEDVYTWFETDKATLPSPDACRDIVVGMTLNEVIQRLGKPQRDIGYGAVIYQFDVSDGSVFTVMFESGPSGALVYDRLIVSNVTFDSEIPEIYFPQQTTLNMLYPWMGDLCASDILKVRYEQSYIGVVPFLFRDIAYSTDAADIQGVVGLFSAPIHAISVDEGRVEGGGYVQYDVFTATERHSVRISNCHVLVDGQYYKLDVRTDRLNSPDVNCHAFVTYPFCDDCEIFTYGENVKVGEYEGLGELEFTALDVYPEGMPKYSLQTHGLTLLLLSADTFLIEDDTSRTVYQLLGDKNFSELF